MAIPDPRGHTRREGAARSMALLVSLAPSSSWGFWRPSPSPQLGTDMLASPMPPRPTRRNARLRPLAELAGRLTARNLRRRGFTQTALVTGWGDIVGPRLASISLPERLVFPGDATDGATLHIRVDGPIALEL
ncbi:MAG: DUF721 domain-containing protein, partial [Alphaproteobacteria bacterium]|nr:DUF721 domain-containing protein [Alphaproteobacteria bacterium]